RSEKAKKLSQLGLPRTSVIASWSVWDENTNDQRSEDGWPFCLQRVRKHEETSGRSALDNDDCRVDVRTGLLEGSRRQVDPFQGEGLKLLPLPRTVGADRDKAAAGLQLGQGVLDMLDVLGVGERRVHQNSVERAKLAVEREEIGTANAPRTAQAKRAGQLLADLHGIDYRVRRNVADGADDLAGAGARLKD